ncbi:Hypothetical protein PBC10988_30950 [Planctomycetales bacterium 10988]|nr:Hypothetical protein PBC10988_30950 [Planctomycetales bacterium 10988]
MWSNMFFHNGKKNNQLAGTRLQLEKLEDRQLLASEPILIEIDPGVPPNPFLFIEFNGSAFFRATDAATGQELWMSDGTSSGTQLVKDINPGTGDSYFYNPVNVNGTLFFRANDGVNGNELWMSDGTSSGTQLVKDIDPGADSSEPAFLTNVNGTLFFRAGDGNLGFELWMSDGTSAGTQLVKDINDGIGNSLPTYLTNIDGTLFFRANDGTNGSELWRSDGTSAGTQLVKDINPGASASSPSNLINVNGTLFFRADDGVDGVELWMSDGTSAGTQLVKNIKAGPDGSYPQTMINVNGILFFAANDGVYGTELWKSDGTSSGTQLVKDIFPGVTSSEANFLTNVNGTLFFRASGGPYGYELWMSDGTNAGTQFVKDINPGGDSSLPFGLTNVNGTLFFRANGGSTGHELWRSNGTSAGTQLVKDLNPEEADSSPSSLSNINNTLFFNADRGVNGRELWVVFPTEPLFVTGSDEGDGSVLVLDATGAEQYDFFPYSQAFTGGVRVATGDLNGDGKLEIVTAAGPGGGPRVRVFDLQTGSLFDGGVNDFYAYAPTITVGVFVAVGDVNSDGYDDIITGADEGGGPHVRVFSGLDGSVITEFYAYDPEFKGGVRVAVGDVFDNGTADIITGAGPGGGPHVRVFDGSFSTGVPLPGAATDFFAYDPSFTEGIFVAAGDVDGDGRADIITGAGPGGGPHVKVFSSADGSLLHNFFAYDPSFTGGVRVASVDLNEDGIFDILTVPGPGGGPHTRAFSGVDLSDLANFYAGDSQIEFGLFVAGGFGELSDIPSMNSAPFPSFPVSQDSDSPKDVNLETLTAKKSWADNTEEFYQSAEEIDKLFSGLGID